MLTKVGMASERGDAPGSWVDGDRGLVSREIFFSDEIYRLELERIFKKVWLFVAHESEIPNPGDFVTRQMGDLPVIVVRCEDGTIAVLLNSCRHRGVKVCRVDSGTAKNFVCPYHGWAYDQHGGLLTTAFDKLLPPGTEFSQWVVADRSAHRVIQRIGFRVMESGGRRSGGLPWRLSLVPRHFLRAHAGWHAGHGTAAALARTGNWKTAAVNFGADNQHIFTTHIGPFTVQPATIPWQQRMKAMEDGAQVVAEDKHCVSFTLTEFDVPFSLYPEELRPLYPQCLDQEQQRVLSGLISGAGTLFPNLSFLERLIPSPEFGAGKTVLLRLWQPISAHEMEIVSWCLAERESSEAYRARSLADGLRNFGISGLFEQEDVELWASIGAASDNAVARAYPMSFMTALPYLNAPLGDFKGPGDAYRPILSEVTQFRFLQYWNRIMTGDA